MGEGSDDGDLRRGQLEGGVVPWSVSKLDWVMVGGGVGGVVEI